ncbi:hypothetical protein QBC39DRAFT_339229 [Podospora conica]|nr:hypothetical protein QBC39DRAFT_339229 [Schizothecium conicum]
MATEFHFFPLLPRELRDEIWKLAIRPALPGAHLFRVHQYTDPEGPAPEHQTSLPLEACGYRSSCISAPQCLPRGVDFDPVAQAAAPISWTLNNPSAYLIDSGLWTACKESLLGIDKEFQARARRKPRLSLSEVEAYRKGRGSFALPETTTFYVSDNSRRRHLTVFPCQDLFIAQLRDITDVDWSFPWNSFPNFELQDGSKDWNRACSAYDRKIAVEYNPAWDRGNHLKLSWHYWDFVVDIVNSLCGGNTALDTLWFIDYRIKRNPRCQESTVGDTWPPREMCPPREIFYASDRRFVEVLKDECGQEDGHDLMWDDGYQVPTEEYPFVCECCGVHGFVNQLTTYWEDKRGEDESRDVGGGWYMDTRLTFGVLACEYL